MKQCALFKDVEPQDKNIKHIGHRLYLKFSDDSAKAVLYHNNTLVKIVC